MAFHVSPGSALLSTRADPSSTHEDQLRFVEDPAGSSAMMRSKNPGGTLSRHMTPSHVAIMSTLSRAFVQSGSYDVIRPSSSYRNTSLN